ncbi:MAG: hypothetical protein ACRBBR_06050 [Cellvibrionaceae bacterium]
MSKMKKSNGLDTTELKKLEGDFLLQYPKGFNSPEMIEIGKKHKMNKMVEMAQEFFTKTACSNPNVTADNMVKMISRSSMVSMFEKPKFRDFVNNLNDNDKAFLVESLSQLLHGKQQLGFEGFVDILRTEKLAKWSLVSIIPAYYSPTKEVFVKPTTAKRVLSHFEMTDPVYKPAPTWDFYKKYRKLINEAKKSVDSDLSPSNAAFSGFLMMSVKA